jgi:Tol biopolymer transport system component/DNA-binding winged helix-turn-helix (wHTH) protein
MFWQSSGDGAVRALVAERYCFDDVEIDPGSFRLVKSGQPVPVEPKALQVLVFLVENRGRLVEKAELLNAVWKDAFVTENVLSRAVAQVRKAMGDGAKDARYIETVPTRGYRFVAKVEVRDESIQSHATLAAPYEPQKNNRLWVIISVIAVVALIVTLGLVLRQQRGREHLQVANSTQITTANGLSMYPTFSPDGSAMAYSADHGKGLELFVRQLAPGGHEVQVTGDGGQNVQPAWSPDGQFIAYHSSQNRGIWLVPALGGSPRQISTFGSHPAWSRDGVWIAFQSAATTDLSADSSGVFPPSTIWQVRSDGRDATQITHPGIPEGGHGAPSWSPDGKHLVFVSLIFGRSSIWATDTRGSSPVQVSPDALGSYDPIYSLDGKSVLYGAVTATTNYGLWQVRISPETSIPVAEPVQIVNSGGVRIKNLALSRDGKKLLYSAVSLTGSLQSLPLSSSGEPSGPPVALSSDAGCRATSPAFSPDGSRIAFSTCRGLSGAIPQVWIMNADGSDKQPLTFGPTASGMAKWLPDGRRILFMQGHWKPSGLFSIDIQTRQESRVASVPQNSETFDLSPDGQQIVFDATTAGIINLWLMDLGDGKTRQLTFDQELLGFPMWSPDGKFIAAEIQRGPDTNIVVVPKSGGPPTQVTFDHTLNWSHSWSPDGDRIIFAKRETTGVWNVWSVSRSTGKQKQLTHYEKLNAFIRYPAMSPRGNQIVYESTESTGNIWMIEFK